VNEPVRLKALTKGRLFSEGGRLVTFYIDGEKIGTTLSGGDGYAFLKYKTSSPGVKTIKTESGDDRDEGSLLVARTKDKVILVEIEGTLFDSPLSFKPDDKGKEVLAKLSKKFGILYITSLAGMSQSRKWLKENSFPLSPVLQWEGTELIEDLQEKHIPLYAIIASPDVLKEAPAVKKRFSFSDAEGATMVKGWDELLEKIH